MSKQKLLQLFALESQETLQQMEDGLLQLESRPADKEAINVVFRAAHTVKGSAGVVGLPQVSEFTHSMENLLDKARSGQLKITPELIRLLLTCRDHVGYLIAQTIESNDPEENTELEKNTKALLKQLQSFITEEASPTVESSATNISAPPAVPTTSPQTQAEPALAVTTHTKPTKLQNIFLMESKDILGRINNELNVLVNRPESTEALNNVFMSIHTIKGSSGLVKVDTIAQFSQDCEHFLQQFRNAKHTPDAHFNTLMQQYVEYLGHLLDEVSSGQKNSQLHENIAHLVANFKAYPKALVPPEQPQTAPTLHTEPNATTVVSAPELDNKSEVTRLDTPKQIGSEWHISLRFHEDAMQNGVEPMATLQHLNNIGDITYLNTLFDAMPPASQMNPEHCYLGFELELKSAANKAAIEAAFELVHSHCDVRILPPNSQLSEYITLIQELPEDTIKLGEILIESGTLTRRELETGLNLQQSVLKPCTDEEQALSTTEPTRKIGQILVEEGMVQQDVVDAALNKQQQIRDNKTRVQKNIQVNAEKLDKLINLVGELVIANAGMNLSLQDIEGVETLRENASLMSRLVEDIRNSTLSMRMVQIGGTFNRFRRLIHDLSQDLNKQIELNISGAETELDKSMVEKITDPLTHLVRNAIDHGIESAEGRRAAGKPENGTVYLHAYHDSGSIVIEVGDDGKGLDLQKILNKAIERKLILPEQDITEEELLRLIFEPGISTAERVTQLSGRGVGLDVVKRDINALNGTVDVISEPEQGTTFQIYLPLTLAIIDGFLLNVGHSSFVIPLDRVVECVAFEAAEQEIEQGYLNLRGKVLPLLHIHSLFNIDQRETKEGEQEFDKQRANIVVVHYGNQDAGLVVDELLGELQAVIKPLGRMFENLSGISGATILGNGEVALILDVPALVQRYATHRSQVHKQELAVSA